MPTKEWFRENPKVTAYVSQSLYSKLDSYMKAEGIRKVSQALTVILEEKFSVRKPVNSSELQKEIDILKSKVDQIELLIKHEFKKELTDLDKGSLDEGFNQLTLGEAPEAEESPKVTQSNPKTKRLTTKQIEQLTGLSRHRLEHKRNTGELPFTIEGHTIVRWVEREHKFPHGNIWEVQEAPPN